MEELDNRELSFVEFCLALMLLKHQQNESNVFGSFGIIATFIYTDPFIKKLALQIGEFMFLYKTCINQDAQLITTPQEMNELLNHLSSQSNISLLAELEYHYQSTCNHIAEHMDLSDESTDPELERKRKFKIVISEMYNFCREVLIRPASLKKDLKNITRWLVLLSDDMM